MSDLAHLDEHDDISHAIGICDRLGLPVAASARAATGTIGNGGNVLLGLPNVVVAAVASNSGYGFEDGEFVDNRHDDFELDPASVRAIAGVAAGNEDYALALLFRFSRNSEDWYSFNHDSASFINYNLPDDSPICDGCIISVRKTFYCTGAEAARVLANANEISAGIATDHLNLFIANANDPAALNAIKDKLRTMCSVDVDGLAMDVAASEHARDVPGIVGALAWIFDVNEERRYLASMSVPWSRATHTELGAQLQDAVVAVLLVAARLASTVVGIRRSIRNGALTPLPPDIVEIVLGHIHPYDYC